MTSKLLLRALAIALSTVWVVTTATARDQDVINPSGTAAPDAATLELPAAMPTTPAKDPIPTVSEMERWRPTIKLTASSQEPSLRERALRETGLQVGSQAALAARTRVQNSEVEAQGKWLTDIYRFDQLLSEKGLVLPPIIIEARRHAEVNGLQLTKIEQSYKLLENAQVVSAPPTWRDYLIASNYPPPVKPEGALLPQNSAEEKIWSEAVRRGWEQGEQQAWLAFKARVGELHRAFLGRVRYLVLLERGLVTPPAIRIARRGVKQDANELLIGRTEITLSRLSEFRLPTPAKKGKKAAYWRALPEVLTTYDDGSSVQ